MRRNGLMHPTGPGVESKAITVLDTRRIDLPRHKRIALAIRLVGGLRATSRVVERSTATVNNWRKADASINVDDLAKLAQAVGVTLDWLAGIDTPAFAANDGRHVDRVAG